MSGIDALATQLVTIYCVAFPDGSRYIGKTKQRLARRIGQHRRETSNPELTRRLSEGQAHSVWVIRKVPESMAHEIEAKEIARLEKPLNFVYATAKPAGSRLPGKSRKWQTGKRRYERNDGRNYRCRICYQWKPGQAYDADAHRSCGVSSVCKVCARRKEKRMRESHKNGMTTSQAYYQEIAAIRQETAD